MKISGTCSEMNKSADCGNISNSGIWRHSGMRCSALLSSPPNKNRSRHDWKQGTRRPLIALDWISFADKEAIILIMKLIY